MSEPPPASSPDGSAPLLKPQYEAPSSSTSGSSASEAARAAPKRNPAFAAMGLPRLRLPSRNWMIFLSIVAGWTVAVQYDRREKRIQSEKWARLVRHLGDETVPTNSLLRKLTVVLAAPPADGIMLSREHFHEYVKPILASASLDWDVVEGRREGDVRAGIAERIRKLRVMKGEAGMDKLLELTNTDVEPLIDELRNKGGVDRWTGVQGDVVIGRHTWKEYVRGLHEGWLGPIEQPAKEVPREESGQAGLQQSDSSTVVGTLSAEKRDDDAPPTSTPSTLDNDTLPESKPESTEDQESSDEDKSKPKKRKQPEPFISTGAYPTATPSKYCPPTLGPSAVIPEPHLLGFLNFPVRIYRYLTKRRLADDIGRQVAAAALGQSRSFGSSLATDDSMHGNHPNAEFEQSSSDGEGSPLKLNVSEQSILAAQEENEWHKSVKAREGDGPGKERVWLDDMVLDPRIASRMRRFELSPQDEARAETLEAEIRREKMAKLRDIPRRIGRGVAVTFGYGPREQAGLTTVGNVGSEDVD